MLYNCVPVEDPLRLNTLRGTETAIYMVRPWFSCGTVCVCLQFPYRGNDKIFWTFPVVPRLAPSRLSLFERRSRTNERRSPTGLPQKRTLRKSMLSLVTRFACGIGQLAKIWIWVSSEVITICIQWVCEYQSTSWMLYSLLHRAEEPTRSKQLSTVAIWLSAGLDSILSLPR